MANYNTSQVKRLHSLYQANANSLSFSEWLDIIEAGSNINNVQHGGAEASAFGWRDSSNIGSQMSDIENGKIIPR